MDSLDLPPRKRQALDTYDQESEFENFFHIPSDLPRSRLVTNVPVSEAPERLHTQPSECLDYERAHPIIMVYRNSYCVPACPYPFYTFGLSCHFNAKSDLELYVQPEVTHFKSPKANHHA